MKTYICENCGDVKDEDELKSHTEYLGNSHGPKYEDVADGCSCGGTYIEAVQCDMCGEWYIPDSIYGMEKHVCINCLSNAISVENAIGFENERSGELYNDFSYMGYSLDDIRELVKTDIKERERLGDPKLKKDIRRVCLGIDKDEFADFISKQEEK